MYVPRQNLLIAILICGLALAIVIVFLLAWYRKTN